jgi:RNA polymerase sigma-70 factor (ECF subfamily)
MPGDWTSVREEVATTPANDTVTTVDARLLEALYRAHGRKILRRATALMRSRDAGQDVMQEVFLRAFGARAALGTAQSQLNWLYRITTNACFNRLRDAGRRERILLRITPSEEASSRHTADDALTVRALVKNVPAQMRELAVHHFVHEMTQDELSSRFEMPRRTVGYRLAQFRSIALQAADDEALAS